MQRRSFLLHPALAAAGVLTADRAQATLRSSGSPVRLWSAALEAAVVATATPAPPAARACALMTEAIYNAWAAYEPSASLTLPGVQRRPFWEGAAIYRTMALSWAAHGVLVDLFPSQSGALGTTLRALVSTVVSGWPIGRAARELGQRVAAALIADRHGDGSNQLGDLAPGAYADYTGYQPVNTPDQLIDPTRWQPLRYLRADGTPAVQVCTTPQWGRVRPFALSAASMYRPSLDHAAPSQDELVEMLNLSAELDDTRKALVDAFAQNPGKGSPPTQWMGFASQVSEGDRNTLEDDVKLFFVCGQALHDAGIACWDAKMAYDTVRPISAVPYFLQGQTFRAWAGYDQGIRDILAEDWIPYQPPTVRTPAFPEFPSGHSTFSAAASTAMAGWRGRDRASIVLDVPAGFVGFETNVPAQTQQFVFPSLSSVAAAAGLSRRQCGIHFIQGDLKGRALGAQVGARVLARCRALFDGRRWPG